MSDRDAIEQATTRALENVNVGHWLETIAKALMRIEERQASIEILLERMTHATTGESGP